LEECVAYNETLAGRLRELLAARPEVSERKMFGGLAFMLRGHMFAGVLDDSLMARVGPQAYSEDLRQPHAREMDFTGKPLRGYIFVGPAGLESTADLERWLGLCLAFAETLPPKASATARR